MSVKRNNRKSIMGNSNSRRSIMGNDGFKVNGTFLFTDIVGSTNLWAEHKDKMAKALTTHNNRIYGYVNQSGGVVVKTIGDAFMIYFPDNVEDLNENKNNLNGNSNLITRNSLWHAILAGTRIQLNLKEYPIYLDKAKNNDTIEIRIGICKGPAEKISIMVQRFVSSENVNSCNEANINFDYNNRFGLIENLKLDVAIFLN